MQSVKSGSNEERPSWLLMQWKSVAGHAKWEAIKWIASAFVVAAAAAQAWAVRSVARLTTLLPPDARHSFIVWFSVSVSISGVALIGIVALTFKLYAASGAARTHLLSSGSDPMPSLNAAAGKRIFVDVDVPFLRSVSARGDTGLEKLRLVSPYLGKWMTVSGPISDVRKGFGSLVVTLANHSDFMSTLVLQFEDKWSHRLEVLPKGYAVTVIGQIRSIEDTLIMLTECELM